MTRIYRSRISWVLRRCPVGAPYIPEQAFDDFEEVSRCLAESLTDGSMTDDDPVRSNRINRIRMTSSHNESMTIAEFVQRKFIPGYVSRQRAAARSYFQAILKYILRPANLNHAFGEESRSSEGPRGISNWPYIDAVPLNEVKPEVIQNILSESLRHGHSPRTATHIRDVLRNIFSYAARSGDYAGVNPATLVVPPVVERREPQVLSVNELRQVMHLMRYPERSIASFALSVDLNVTEICGLQWQYVNLSSGNRTTAGELLPPRTIAIRNMSYRGVFEAVSPRRRRLVSIPDVLYTELTELKRRERFVSPEDFVIASRTGTPVSPDNIAWRRLRAIGKALDMPWLSWKVFHHTRNNLVQQFGRYWNRELEQILQPRVL